jgi:2-polyprenyl-6-methoxyphenol hydroxylase-like FAD-dependent oxidoreductase
MALGHAAGELTPGIHDMPRGNAVGGSRVGRVAIVGAGLAGLATAAAAASAGMQVDVFERTACLATLRSHIDVAPTLMRDLVTLGVAEACVRRGFPYRGLAVVDANGKPVLELPTPALAGPRWPAAMGMVYRDLLQVLHDAAVTRGARLHWGVPIDRVEASAGLPYVGSSAGAAWCGDLVVLAGATGAFGIELPLADRTQSLPQRWDHLLLPRPRGLDRSTWIVGAGRHKALLVPVSAAQAGLALLRDETIDRSTTQLRADLVRHGGMLAGLAAHVAHDAVVLSRPVRSGLLAGEWHLGGALRIGSSAHVLPPHFGQAAAQSVEDATVLGELLRQGLARSDLLTRFMSRRAERAALAHAVATQAAHWDMHPDASTDLPALARRLAPIFERAP